jgi:predicted PhzF superfamily epimerase YddE/YHI9
MVFLQERKWRNLSATVCLTVWEALCKAKIKPKKTKLTQQTWGRKEHVRQRQNIERDVGTHLRSWANGEGVPEDVYDYLTTSQQGKGILQKFQLRRKGSPALHDDISSSAGKSNARGEPSVFSHHHSSF